LRGDPVPGLDRCGICHKLFEVDPKDADKREALAIRDEAEDGSDLWICYQCEDAATDVDAQSQVSSASRSLPRSILKPISRVPSHSKGFISMSEEQFYGDRFHVEHTGGDNFDTDGRCMQCGRQCVPGEFLCFQCEAEAGED